MQRIPKLLQENAFGGQEPCQATLLQEGHDIGGQEPFQKHIA